MTQNWISSSACWFELWISACGYSWLGLWDTIACGHSWLWSPTSHFSLFFLSLEIGGGDIVNALLEEAKLLPNSLVSLEIRNLSNSISLKGNEFQHLSAKSLFLALWKARIHSWRWSSFSTVQQSRIPIYLAWVLTKAGDSNSHQYERTRHNGLFKAWVPTRTGASFLYLFSEYQEGSLLEERFQSQKGNSGPRLLISLSYA